MSRCDYEGAFYRVFCVGLLLIAFTFTVILTNVFVDIDNLLSKKDRESTEKVETIDPVTDGIQPSTEVPDYYIGNERNDEVDENYRTKRSLDSENFFLRINSPKTKSYLTNRLAALLEALDDEETENTTPKKDNGNIYIKTVKQKNNIEINELRPERSSRGQKTKEDLLHQAMHNVLLQGIAGRLDLDGVYRKLQALVGTFKHNENKKDTNNAKSREEFYSETTTQGKSYLNEEQSLIQELLKYKMGEEEPQDSVFDFDDAPITGSEEETKTDKKRARGKVKSPKYLIKTLIDIKKDENANSKENFQGVIRLIYNGKPIKIRSDDHDHHDHHDHNNHNDELTVRTPTAPTTMEQRLETKQTNKATKTIETATNSINKDVAEFADVLKDNYKNKHVTNSHLKEILVEYLKKLANSNDSSATITESNKSRIKRNLEWSIEKQTETCQTKDDDELFVEIETHFDKKGLKGDKKRKLVSSLIKKIQNAIDSESKHQDKDSSEPLIIKRVQNPLDHGTAHLINTLAPTASNLYRELNPISKSMPVLEPLPQMSDKNGDNWKMEHNDEPKFLSTLKSINSAELGQLNVYYSKETKDPMIPKRTQVPLSTDTSDENINTVDVGKLQLLIKDIEGTGFSIGYNQYIDQEPDPESIKLFHGIEGIVKTYHEKHDKPNQNGDFENEYEMYGQELKKREVENPQENRGEPLRTKRFVLNRHNVRRSVNENYHTNEYIYNDNYRSFDAYKEIYDSPEINTKEKEHPMMLKEKPSEMSAYRKKRSLNLKRIVNLKKKIRINKYLNTKRIPRQRMDMGKRFKRQINNIKLSDKNEQAGENNNMYIVSGYNDNLIVRHRQSPGFFFGLVQQVRRNNDSPHLKHQPFFQPSHEPRPTTTTTRPQRHEHKNVFDENISKINITRKENKERNKRQIHSIRIIAKDMVNKGSNGKSFAEYEDIYADRSAITQIDDPIITIADKADRVGMANGRMDNEQVMYRNPFAIRNNQRTSGNSPLLFGHDNHAFSLDPLVQQMKDNPLMSKYPHIFVEDRTSGERPEFKHIHRTVYSPRSDSKERDVSENEDSYSTSNLENLVNAVVPSHRNNYKVSLKLIPHDSYNDTKPSFKEIHTTINKTYNKNGLLYSSLVNVSEISKVIELTNKTNMNTTHFYNKHSKKTTPPNIANKDKPSKRTKGTEFDLMTQEELAKERNKILRIIKKESIETKEPDAQTSLMDIILPSNPPKVFHLTFADVGKLICNSMTSTTTTTSTAATSPITTEKLRPTKPKTTTISTTVPSTQVPTTTNKPEKLTTYANPQTEDPLKIKLLNAISLNEQLTSQILDRIDQNTGVLQTFLKKITSEIAKLPDIANQAINKNRNDPYDNQRPIPNVYTVNGSYITPLMYALPTQNTNSAPKQTIQTTPLVKRIRMNDRISELQRNLKVNNSDELKQRDKTKYFIDDDLNKTVPAIDNELQKNPVKDGMSDKTISIKRAKEVFNETTKINITTVIDVKKLIKELEKFNIPEIIQNQLKPEDASMILTMLNTILEGILGYRDIHKIHKKLISTILSGDLPGQNENANKPMDRFETTLNGTTSTLYTLNGRNYATNELQKGRTADQNPKMNEDVKKGKPVDNNKKRKYLVKVIIDIKNNKSANIKEILQDLTELIYNRNLIPENSPQVMKIRNPKQVTKDRDSTQIQNRQPEIVSTTKSDEIDDIRVEITKQTTKTMKSNETYDIRVENNKKTTTTMKLNDTDDIRVENYKKTTTTMKSNDTDGIRVENNIKTTTTTMKSNEKDNVTTENYKQITTTKKPISDKVTITDGFRKLAALVLDKRNIPDVLKMILAEDSKTHKNYTTPTKSNSNSENKEEFETTIEDEVHTGIKPKVIKGKIKRKGISLLAKLKKNLTENKFNRTKIRVKRLVGQRVQEQDVSLVDLVLTNWKALIYAAYREIRNFDSITRMYPPKKAMADHWRKHKTIIVSDPKSLTILARCSKLMLEQLYGIQTDYDSIIPKSYLDVKVALRPRASD